MTSSPSNDAKFSTAYQRKKEKDNDRARDFLFEICRIVLMPERDRLAWVRQAEKAYGFSMLRPAKKKMSLKLVT
jgi:hypothetical protein